MCLFAIKTNTKQNEETNISDASRPIKQKEKVIMNYLKK